MLCGLVSNLIALYQVLLHCMPKLYWFILVMILIEIQPAFPGRAISVESFTFVERFELNESEKVSGYNNKT